MLRVTECRPLKAQRGEKENGVHSELISCFPYFKEQEFSQFEVVHCCHANTSR